MTRSTTQLNMTRDGNIGTGTYSPVFSVWNIDIRVPVLTGIPLYLLFKIKIPVRTGIPQYSVFET
jgi:hypothetical protein